MHSPRATTKIAGEGRYVSKSLHTVENVSVGSRESQQTWQTREVEAHYAAEALGSGAP